MKLGTEVMKANGAFLMSQSTKMGLAFQNIVLYSMRLLRPV